MSRRIMSAAVSLIVGACLLWGGNNLLGQTVTPKQAPASVPAAVATPGVPVIGAATGGGADPLSFAPFDASTSGVSSTGVIIPGTPAVTTEGVAAIPLPPSVYPGMVGLATAAYAGWRYRRRRR